MTDRTVTLHVWNSKSFGKVTVQQSALNVPPIPPKHYR